MSSLHHLDSRYAYLSPEAIDFVLEHVRDANEVLFESKELDARSMILAARSVAETEWLLERDPQIFAEPGSVPLSDWTFACMAEGMCQAVTQLRERGATAAVKQVNSDLRAILMRIIDSPVRSPLLGYGSILSDLMYQHRPSNVEELLPLQRRAIAEDLLTHHQSNVLSYLCELGDSRLRLGQEEFGLLTFLQLTRFAPTDIALHNQLAITLERRYPELARSSAERALLLMPRDDQHGLRPQLRRMLEQLASKTTDNLLPAVARGLLIELRSPPGKRGRASLRTLSMEIDPAIEQLPQKELEALPDVTTLAKLRADLKTFPRPRAAQAIKLQSPALAPLPLLTDEAASRTRVKVGRNELCPCGSQKKYKRCCVR